MRLTLEQLIPQAQDRLYQAAYAVCGNRQDAEDAVQDAFLKYYRSQKEFDTQEHLEAWLLRVTVNRGRDLVRAFWRRNRESLEDYAETLAFQAPEDGEVFRAVMGLKPKYRAVIYLYYREGYSVREIAGALGVREGTVKSWMSRARARLKEILQEGWRDEEP